MLTDSKLRSLRYKELRSNGPQIEGAIHKRTGRPMENRAGQLLQNRLPDRDGMYVNVSPGGTVTFRFDYRWPRSAQGRRQCAVHGRYPVMTLEEARDAHREFLRKLAKGINPLDERRQERQQEKLPDDFKAVAGRWYEKNKPEKSKSWLEANLRYLNAAYPYIGTKRMEKITAQNISAIITPIESSGRAVTAEKMRQTYVMVFDHAAGKEFLIPAGANPARVLSVDRPETKHHAHIPYTDLPTFLKAVDADSGAEHARLGVRLLLLTLVRKEELASAKWTDIDDVNARWQLTAKGAKIHVVPLSRQAVAIFQRLKELAEGSDWVFPKRSGKGRLSHMNGDLFNHVIYRAGYKGRHTVHGTRSTASSALNETGLFNPDAIERQLSHKERDEVRGSYNHSDYLQERARMLQVWGDGIDRLCVGRPLVETADNVVQLHAAA